MLPKSATAVREAAKVARSNGGAGVSGLHWRQATVASVNASAGTARVRLGGVNTVTADIPSLVPVTTSDTVWVVVSGGDMLIVGHLDSGWIVPTLGNSWVNHGGVYATAAYRKINGVVYLKGLIKNGTLAQTVFQLPVGYRPTAYMWFPVSVYDGTNYIARLCEIYDNGAILIHSGTALTYVSLSGISFPADS